jgi:hypothetical protein
MNVNFNALQTIKDNLAQAGQENASVTLHLRNGMSLSGRVGEVGDHAVDLAQLTGKEFYDAGRDTGHFGDQDARADKLIPAALISGPRVNLRRSIPAMTSPDIPDDMARLNAAI